MGRDTDGDIDRDIVETKLAIGSMVAIEYVLKMSTTITMYYRCEY